MLYANYWIAHYILLTLIHWIVIYLVDSVIHALNNWALMFRNINELYWQYELFDCMQTISFSPSIMETRSCYHVHNKNQNKTNQSNQGDE